MPAPTFNVWKFRILGFGTGVLRSDQPITEQEALARIIRDGTPREDVADLRPALVW